MFNISLLIWLQVSVISSTQFLKVTLSIPMYNGLAASGPFCCSGWFSRLFCSVVWRSAPTIRFHTPGNSIPLSVEIPEVFVYLDDLPVKSGPESLFSPELLFFNCYPVSCVSSMFQNGWLHHVVILKMHSPMHNVFQMSPYLFNCFNSFLQAFYIFKLK